MAKRPGQAGKWVLPTAGFFLACTVLYIIVRVLAMVLKSSILGYVAIGVGLLLALSLAGTIAGIAYLLLAQLQQQQQASDASQLEQLLRKQNQLLDSIYEGILVSDRSKAVAFREKERDALRRAIHEEISRQDWEAAYHLVEDMQKNFGYHKESERLRQEIDQQRAATIRASMATDVARFREFLKSHDWESADTEARLIMNRYPEAAEAENLPHEIHESREAHKRSLLKQFKEAIDRSEVDRGIELLKELDDYLTAGEAAGLEEAARGVFKARMHNLGVQFSIAISEKNWTSAIDAGQQIIDEFPNSRFAQEVRENLPALKKRAEEARRAPARG